MRRLVPPRTRRGERGAIMLIAISLIVILTLLGAVAMRTVQLGVDVAGAERASDQAFYIAEAGMAGAMAELHASYWIAPPTDKLDIAALFDSADMGAPIGTPGVLFGWQQFAAPQVFGNGSYTLYFKDDVAEGSPGDDTPPTTNAPNDVVLMRVKGVAGTAQRLLEAAISEN